MAIEIVFVDAAVIRFRHTDAEPDGQLVFASLAQAKREALATARQNRDDWNYCIARIRETGIGDVQP